MDSTCGREDILLQVVGGNVTDEIIREYIQNQDIQENSNSDNFEIG